MWVGVGDSLLSIRDKSMSLKTFTVKWYGAEREHGAEVLKAQMGKKFKSPIDGKSKLWRVIPEPIVKCLICQKEDYSCKCREKWPNIASEDIEVLDM